MALCDDLDAKQTKKRDLATQSTHSALTALTTAETAADLAAAWRRVEENPELLSISPELLNAWRLAILELLVDGSLWCDRGAGVTWPRASVSEILAESLANGPFPFRTDGVDSRSCGFRPSVAGPSTMGR